MKALVMGRADSPEWSWWLRWHPPRHNARVVSHKSAEMEPYASLMDIAVQPSVRDSLGEVGGGDFITCREVGNGAGDFEDALIGARGEAQAFDGVFGQFVVGVAQAAVFFDPVPIRERWNEHLSGLRNWQAQLWTVLMFQAWLAEHA